MAPHSGGTASGSANSCAVSGASCLISRCRRKQGCRGTGTNFNTEDDRGATEMDWADALHIRNSFSVVLRGPRSSSVLKPFFGLYRRLGRPDVHPTALPGTTVVEDAATIIASPAGQITSGGHAFPSCRCRFAHPHQRGLRRSPLHRTVAWLQRRRISTRPLAAHAISHWPLRSWNYRTRYRDVGRRIRPWRPLLTSGRPPRCPGLPIEIPRVKLR